MTASNVWVTCGEDEHNFTFGSCKIYLTKSDDEPDCFFFSLFKKETIVFFESVFCSSWEDAEKYAIKTVLAHEK